MNIVFMGTSDFAVPTLQVLSQHAEYEVRAVFTRPDAVSKRGNALIPTPVRRAAEQLGLAAIIHTPPDFYAHDEQGVPLRTTSNDGIVSSEVLGVLEQAKPDMIIVEAYSALIPPAVLALPYHGCINIHASLLPRWRGAAPIQRALLAGDEELGVSIMRMEKGLDTGPYCATATTVAGDKNAVALTAELALLGSQLLIDTLPAIVQDTVQWIPQDETKATYAEKLAKHELDLNPVDTVIVNHRRVRASSPQNPAHAYVSGRAVIVLSTRIPGESKQQDHKRLIFTCSDGDLEIVELKPEGKKAMSASAFIAGLR